MPPQTTAVKTKNPINKFLLVLLVLIIIGGGGAGAYFYQAYQDKISKLTTKLTTTTSQLDSASQQNKTLQQQMGQITCKGTWSNDTCTPYPVSLTGVPTEGKSPLKVVFTIKVPDTNYTVDFGDSVKVLISSANGVDSAGKCTPGPDGLCSLTLSHSYKSSTSTAVFVAKLMQGETVATSATITVNK